MTREDVMHNAKALEEAIGGNVIVLDDRFSVEYAGRMVVVSMQEFILKDSRHTKEVFNTISKGHSFILYDGEEYYSVEYLDKRLSQC